MLLRGKKLLVICIFMIIILGYSYGFSACLGIGGGGVSIPDYAKRTGIYVKTDIKPTSRFEEARIKSVSVLKFDAKYVKSKGGEIIDYINLSNKFTDDLLKRFYQTSKIDVALGEYEDKIIETDILEKKRGDLEVQGNTLKRSIEYKATPYKKIQAILGGRINKYQEADNWDKSYIEITLKLTDTYSGSIFWITDMRGFVKDVADTIVKSIIARKYTEPLSAKAKKLKEKKAKKSVSKPKKAELKKKEEVKSKKSESKKKKK